MKFHELKPSDGAKHRKKELEGELARGMEKPLQKAIKVKAQGLEVSSLQDLRVVKLL